MLEVIRLLGENIAGITAAVHTHDRYWELYDTLRDDIGGFPGIWHVCASVGAAFTDAEIIGGHVAGESYDWIAAVLNLASRVVEVCIDGDGPDAACWRAEAAAAIADCRYEKERGSRASRSVILNLSVEVVDR